MAQMERIRTAITVGLITWLTIVLLWVGSAFVYAMVLPFCSSQFGCRGDVVLMYFQISNLLGILSAISASIAYLCLRWLPAGPTVLSMPAAAALYGLLIAFPALLPVRFIADFLRVDFIFVFVPVSFALAATLLWLADKKTQRGA